MIGEHFHEQASAQEDLDALDKGRHTGSREESTGVLPEGEVECLALISTWRYKGFVVLICVLEDCTLY